MLTSISARSCESSNRSTLKAKKDYLTFEKENFVLSKEKPISGSSIFANNSYMVEVEFKIKSTKDFGLKIAQKKDEKDDTKTASGDKTEGKDGKGKDAKDAKLLDSLLKQPDPAKGEARQVVISLRARTIVVAAGAIERPLVRRPRIKPKTIRRSDAGGSGS